MDYILKRDEVAEDATQTYSVIYPKTVRDIDGKNVTLPDRIDRVTVQEIEDEIAGWESRIAALRQMLAEIQAL